jgi:hypothetical protein
VLRKSDLGHAPHSIFVTYAERMIWFGESQCGKQHRASWQWYQYLKIPRHSAQFAIRHRQVPIWTAPANGLSNCIRHGASRRKPPSGRKSEIPEATEDFRSEFCLVGSSAGAVARRLFLGLYPKVSPLLFFIHPATAISRNRNGSRTRGVVKAHYRKAMNNFRFKEHRGSYSPSWISVSLLLSFLQRL